MLAYITKQSQLILTVGVVLTNIHYKIKPAILYHDNKISLCIKTNADASSSGHTLYLNFICLRKLSKFFSEIKLTFHFVFSQPQKR